MEYLSGINEKFKVSAENTGWKFIQWYPKYTI